MTVDGGAVFYDLETNHSAQDGGLGFCCIYIEISVGREGKFSEIRYTRNCNQEVILAVIMFFSSTPPPHFSPFRSFIAPHLVYVSQ
jgi:hypothetical protein